MALPDLPGSSLLDGLFGAGLSQHARLITLARAQDSTLPEALMPERFTGREAVNELFSFDIDALSTSTERMLQAQSISIYVPSGMLDLKLDLVAVVS